MNWMGYSRGDIQEKKNYHEVLKLLISRRITEIKIGYVPEQKEIETQRRKEYIISMWYVEQNKKN